MNNDFTKNLLKQNEARRAKQISAYDNVNTDSNIFKFNQETQSNNIPEVSGLGNNEHLNDMAIRQQETDRLNMLNGDNLDTIHDGTKYGNFLKILSDTESKGDYKAQNKSGAYGKYQFMPSTEAEYAKKLNMTIPQARTPNGQEAMIKKFTEDNANFLKKNNIPVTDEFLWYAHNLGRGGARAIHRGEGVNMKHIASNVPSDMKPTLANYRNHYRKKFNPNASSYTVVLPSQTKKEPDSIFSLPDAPSPEFLAKEQALLNS